MSEKTEWWEHMLSLVEQQNKELKEWIEHIKEQELAEEKNENKRNS
jgi:hypothetical protein